MGRTRSDIIYNEIKSIVTVPRGLGLWGDMVVTLKDGSRLEFRALPKFRDVADYINDKIGANAVEVAV
jgi:nitrogen fixation protein